MKFRGMQVLKRRDSSPVLVPPCVQQRPPQRPLRTTAVPDCAGAHHHHMGHVHRVHGRCVGWGSLERPEVEQGCDLMHINCDYNNGALNSGNSGMGMVWVWMGMALLQLSASHPKYVMADVDHQYHTFHHVMGLCPLPAPRYPGRDACSR